MAAEMIDYNDVKERYFIDYEGCPMECSKEEYVVEMNRISLQTIRETK